MILPDSLIVFGSLRRSKDQMNCLMLLLRMRQPVSVRNCKPGSRRGSCPTTRHTIGTRYSTKAHTRTADFGYFPDRHTWTPFGMGRRAAETLKASQPVRRFKAHPRRYRHPLPSLVQRDKRTLRGRLRFRRRKNYTQFRNQLLGYRLFPNHVLPASKSVPFKQSRVYCPI